MTHHTMALWEPTCLSASQFGVLGHLSTLCLPYLTSDMTNSTECHLCHRLFWSGNRGTAEYDRRKQSLRKCALQRDTVCQAGQRLKFFGRCTKTGERRREERQESVWEVTSQIPTNRSGNSLWFWLVCGQQNVEWLCMCACRVRGWAQGLKEQACCRHCKDNVAFHNRQREGRGIFVIPPSAHDFQSVT